MAGGRPTLFTPARIGLILESVRGGQSVAKASARARVDDSTVSHWKETGEKHSKAGKDTPFSKFYNDLKQADADCQLALILTVKSASKTQWTAAAWLLERKWHEEWGRRDAVSLVAPTQGSGDIPAILEIRLPAKQELPDAVQVKSPSPQDGQHGPGDVQKVDGGHAELRKPPRARGKKRTKGNKAGRRLHRKKETPPPSTK